MPNQPSNHSTGNFYSIWRINMHSMTWQREPVPDRWQHLGVRGLLARLLVDEVPAT
jgi:hypothetical protein